MTLKAPPALCCKPLAGPDMTEGDVLAAAELFRALSDPHRVRIVNLLANAPAPVCVCDLQGSLGLSQPTVSFHVKKLVSAGLLRRDRRGTWAFYSLDREALSRLGRTFDTRRKR